MIKKILILLTVVLNLMLPLRVFAKEEVTDLKNTETQKENIELEKGQGSVVENTTDNSKEFFTIMTENGATFYLVVDKNKTSENVYFLKSVDEVDLMKLAGGNNAVIYEETTQSTTEATTEITSIEEIKHKEKKSSFGFFGILVILGVILLVGVLAYDKFFKGKVKNSNFDDEEFEENEEKLEEEETTTEDLDGFINKKID